MGSVAQNGWDQLTNQYIASIAFALLYYDYLLTFDRERRLFWARHGFQQWGSFLFFFNRYCGILGHVPVIIQTFASPTSASYQLCHGLRLYHQILALVMHTVVGFTFITRTYALYDRSRVVLAGLITLALVVIALAGYMISQGEGLVAEPVLPNESVGCSTGLSWSQAWRLAAAWCGAMVFDFVVVVMTLVRTIQINRRSGKDNTLTHVLIRDGVLYFGVIGLAIMWNVVTFLHGSELTRGVATTITNVLACVLVSRLMFNLREPRRHSVSQATTTITAATSSIPMSTTVLQHTLTKVEEADEPMFYERRNNQGEIEMVPIPGCHPKRVHGVEA